MNDFLPRIARDLNILVQDNPRKVKLNSIKRITSEIEVVSGSVLEDSTRELIIPLNTCLSDTVESVRETAAVLLHDIVVKLSQEKIIPILSCLIPTLKDRLANKEIMVESSEEIRLALLKLLKTIILKTNTNYNNYVEHSVDILKVVLSDAFQGCRKEACAIVELLAQYNSKALGLFGDALVKAVLPCIGHRHSAVRILGLQALKAAMIVNLDGLDAALTHLWMLTLDTTGNVREKLYTVAGEWLLELPDRYSIGYKILPLLLAGLQDDMPSLREKSKFYINEAGKLYEKEWESRVKDEMDYTDGRDLYDGRPGVGCRHLARDNTLKIVEKMVEGMGDWTPDKRAKSAQILSSFLDYTEDKISGYTATILAALYKIMAGDDIHVINNCVQLCQNLGRFVSPDVYIDLILPQIQTGGGGAIQFLIGSLKVLSNLLKGSTQSKTCTIDHITRVTRAISSNELISNENLAFRIEMAFVVNSILGMQIGAFAVDNSVSYSIFYILVHLKSTEGDATLIGYSELSEQVEANTILFLKHLGLPNVQRLTAQYFDTIILEFKNSVSSWTAYSPELRLFSTVVTQAGSFVGSRLDLIFSLCEELVNPDRDFQVKSSVFALLNKLMENPALTLNSKMELVIWSEKVLCNILINNLVWKAGRKYMMMRSFATQLFLKFLSCETFGAKAIGCLDKNVLQNQLDKRILPNLVSNLDEDIQKARNEDLMILSILLSHLDFEAPQFKILYPELLKRLDDSQDDIRRQALRTLSAFFDAIARWQFVIKDLEKDENIATVKDDSQECGYREIRLDAVHWEAMVKGMAIHLDDLNSKIQDDCCEAFLALVKVAPSEIVRDLLTTSRTKHRSPKYIDMILMALAEK